MRLIAAPVLVLCASFGVGVSGEKPDTGVGPELPGIVMPIEFTMVGPNEMAIETQQGYYRPVQPQPQQGPPCGHYGTPICKVDVDIPPGVTGEQLYQMAKESMAGGRKGESLAYLEKSAELGYAVAQGALGTAYINADGEPRDPNKGVYWLEKSAAQGNRGAEVELGMVYEDGLGGVPVSPGKAVGYLKMAAAQHQSLAEYRIGLDYEIGRGLPHNRTTAVQYLRQAAADGQMMAGKTANFLAQSRAPQFHTIDDIDTAMNPVVINKPNTSGVGCPAQEDSTWFGRAGDVIDKSRAYCIFHPNCPFRAQNQTYYCAGDQTPLKIVRSPYP